MRHFRETISTVTMTLGWSQRRMALALGVHRATFNGWFTGKREPSPAKQQEIVEKMRILIRKKVRK